MVLTDNQNSPLQADLRDIARNGAILEEQINSEQACKDSPTDEDGTFPPGRVEKMPQVTKKSLLRAIGTELLPTIPRGLQETLGILPELSDRYQDRISEIIHSNEIKQFLIQPESEFLLIQSNSGPFAAKASLRASSISAAIIATAVQNVTRKSRLVHLLSFFCGLHKQDYTDEFGPYGMMLALVRQQISSHPSESFPYLDLSTPSRVRESSRFLGRLMVKLSANMERGSMIFCLLDSVDVFDAPICRGEMRIIIRKLFSAVKSASCSFKLLAIAKHKSTYFLEELKLDPTIRKQVFEVPANISHRRGTGIRPAVLEHYLSHSLFDPSSEQYFPQ